MLFSISKKKNTFMWIFFLQIVYNKNEDLQIN